MSSVLRSTKQTASKFFVALATTVVGFVITDEDTAAPTVDTRSISSGVALGTIFVDMGKIVKVLTGASAATYRKLKLADAVYQGTADAAGNTIWIQEDLTSGVYEVNGITQFARL